MGQHEVLVGFRIHTAAYFLVAGYKPFLRLTAFSTAAAVMHLFYERAK
jgi:hypothetical protein